MDATRANDEVADQGDLEDVKGRKVSSHIDEHDGREEEQAQADQSILNSNSNFGPKDGQPRVSLKGSINSQLDASARSTCNEYGAAKTKSEIQGIDVAEKGVMNESQGSKGNRFTDANSEEVASESPRFEFEGGNLYERSNSSSRSKAIKVNIGNSSDKAINS